MAEINTITYSSQLDDDHGKYTGACAETCIKMVAKYLFNKEYPIKDIVEHGDNNGNFTTIAGYDKAAAYCGFHVKAQNSNLRIVHDLIAEGHLVIMAVKYGPIPNKYKQDILFQGDHALQIGRAHV